MFCKFLSWKPFSTRSTVYPRRLEKQLTRTGMPQAARLSARMEPCAAMTS